jgi:hypothetical protein
MDTHHHERKSNAQSFCVLPVHEAAGLQRSTSPRLSLTVPRSWRSPVHVSPHAAAAEDATLAWFESLGCSPAELERAKRFDIGGYVGIPFPTLDLDQTVRIGKYLALWLLWDDVDVEGLHNGWRIESADVLAGRRPPDLTRFDEGWWQLMNEFRGTRSRAWIERLCRLMRRWSAAASEEGALRVRHRDTGELPSFANQLELRIATIGMYGTACLLEEIHDDEPPAAFHVHPVVSMLQYLASKIVGLGNELFSFAKDHVEGQLNLVSTSMREFSTNVDDALATLVRLHDEAIEEYDRLAAQIGLWATSIYPGSERWIHDLRVASLGFSLWEAQAPRYVAHQIVSEGRVLRPRFRYVDAEPAPSRAGRVPT